jgi:hypothetical protein
MHFSTKLFAPSLSSSSPLLLLILLLLLLLILLLLLLLLPLLPVLHVANPDHQLVTIEYSVALFHVFEIIVYQLDDTDRFGLAEACAREAVYARETLLGLQHPRVQLLRQRLVAFLLRSGQIDEVRLIFV